MKHIINTVVLGIVIIGFSACGSSQQLVDKPSFPLGEVRIEPWTAGEGNNLKGDNIYVSLPETTGGNVTLDSVYYNNRAAKLEHYKKDGYGVYIGRLVNNKPQDMVMHADPKKEFGNKPPKLPAHPPFELQEGEALLSYLEHGTKKYYKITEMKPASAIHYRELPPSLKNE